MAVTLTPRAVAKVAAGATIRDVWDAHTTGLGVRVFPSGVKSWTLRYRIGRRLRRMTLGSVSVLTLADARQAARDALKLVAAGQDPAEEKQDRRDADTVGVFATTYIDKHAKPRKKSWKVDQMRLTIDVLPTWRHRLMKDITRRDIRELLDTIAARPAPIVANRVRSLLHKFFNVAIQMDVVEANPVTATRRPGVERQRDRVLTADEIRTFWTACDALPPVMGAAFKLRLLTAQRGGEVFQMRWQDIDLPGAWWTIPSTASKNRLPHRVPLSAPAVKILTDLHDAEDKHGVLVFRGGRGKRQQAEATATIKIEDFQGHDLRRTAATAMTSAGIARLVVGKVLNHQEAGGTRVYDRASYDTEKRVALDTWARTLTAILEQREADVLAFVRA